MAYRWTKPKEEWIKDINPIIVDKTNYYLNVFKALKVFEGHMQAHCLIPSNGGSTTKCGEPILLRSM